MSRGKPRTKRPTGQNTKTFAIDFDLQAMEDLIDSDVAAIEAAVRPAAQAGAQVLYEAVQRNVASIGSKSGKLAKAIYQAYSAANSGPMQATYHVSWNHTKAPHGALVEFGHVQRYATYLDEAGNWKTAVRNVHGPIKRPGRKASQAAKDAYYVPLKGGPKVVAARPFIRPAMALFPQAQAAMVERLLQELADKGVIS